MPGFLCFWTRHPHSELRKKKRRLQNKKHTPRDAFRIAEVIQISGRFGDGCGLKDQTAETAADGRFHRLQSVPPAFSAEVSDPE